MIFITANYITDKTENERAPLKVINDFGSKFGN